MGNRKTGTIVVLTAVLALLVTAGGARALPPIEEPVGQDEPRVAAILSPLLQYQGRLTDPGTGAPIGDGTYSISFRLYDVESGGTWLWTETEDLSVENGLLSTVLGDITTLDQSLFDGQALWLGIKVGADPEATPRQQVLPVAYALSLVPGAIISANSSSATLEVNNAGSGDALDLGGDLTVSGSLTGGSHNHSGANITSGTVVDARIASTLARDSEIMSLVLAGDGSGSGLDADRLDGSHASSFATASHAHTGTDIVDGSIETEDLADGTVTSDDIEDLTRIISFPAEALNYQEGTIISQGGSGLRWQQSSSAGAYVSVARPADWDSASDIELHLYFFTSTSTSGNVDFFIRPRSYDPGDTWGDAASLSASPVPVSQIYSIKEQVFTITRSRIGTGALWVITMQRRGSGSTYPDDIFLMSVALHYNAVR